MRYKGYNYSSAGKYFVTICTRNKIHYFGRIENGEMILSELGKCLQTEWLATPEKRPDMNIYLDEFVVMPDHFHAIIVFGDNKYNQILIENHCGGTMHCASTIEFKNKFGPQKKNLSSVIRGVKSAVTTYARKMNLDFDWQTKFQDHIIHTRIELSRIRKYIRENPEKWSGK